MCPEAHPLVFHHVLCHKTTTTTASPLKLPERLLSHHYSVQFLCVCQEHLLSACERKGPEASPRTRIEVIGTLMADLAAHTGNFSSLRVGSPPPLRDTHHTDTVRCQEFVPTHEIPHYSYSTSHAHTEVSKVVRSGPPVCQALEPQR